MLSSPIDSLLWQIDQVMAENQDNNMHNFYLSFQDSWDPQELIRRGRKKDPLNKKLRVASVHQYEEAIFHKIQPKGKVYDFTYDEDEIIIPRLSNGKSIIYFNLSVRYEMDGTRACE